MTTSIIKIGMDDLRIGVHAAMAERGMNRRDLADASGVNICQVYNFLAGRANLGAANVDKLLAALRMRIMVIPEEYFPAGVSGVEEEGEQHDGDGAEMGFEERKEGGVKVQTAPIRLIGAVWFLVGLLTLSPS